MGNRSVIVIDDDVGFGQLLRRVVSGMGHVVEHVTDPNELIDRYEEISPEVIFLDIFMPGMDGMEMAKWLLENRFAGKLVFMTGHDRTFLAAARATMLGSDAEVITLEKPVRVDQVREVLQYQRKDLHSVAAAPSEKNDWGEIHKS